MSGHKFKIGQLVSYHGRERTPGVYQITQLLPPEGDEFQYRDLQRQRLRHVFRLHGPG